MRFHTVWVRDSVVNKITNSVPLPVSLPTASSEHCGCIVMIYGCDYRRGMDCWMDLLTTYIHHSELQVITAPPLISTLYRSSQHLLSLFPARCVFNRRCLTTDSNSGGSSVPALTSLLAVEYPATELIQQKSKSKLCYDRWSVGQCILA
jgi:hypothetical protein